MNLISEKHNIFSIVEFIQNLVNAKFTQEQAQVIAGVIEKVEQQHNATAELNQRELALNIKAITATIEKQAELIKEQRHEIEAQHHTLEIIQSREPATKQDLSVIEYKIVSVEAKIVSVEAKIVSVEAKIVSVEANLKKDMQVMESNLKYSCLKFIVWTGATVVITLGGMMAKGFGWF